MATVSASLSLTSTDLTSNGLAISTSTNLVKAGTKRTGLDNTSGVGRKSTESTNQYTLLYADEYTADKAHKVYLKNTSVVASEYFLISIDDEPMGRLYAGDFAIFPWSATDGTKEVATLTFTGTWTTSDSLTFDGVTVTTGSGVNASGAAMRAAVYPNWTTSGADADCIFTAKKSRADQEIDASEMIISDASGSDATISVATTTNGLDDASNIKITPSVATTMTLEHALLYEL